MDEVDKLLIENEPWKDIREGDVLKLFDPDSINDTYVEARVFGEGLQIRAFNYEDEEYKTIDGKNERI